MQRQLAGRTDRLQATLTLFAVLITTEPGVPLACSSPTGVDKAIEAAACTQRLSGTCVLPLSRSDDEYPLPTQSHPVMTYPRLSGYGERPFLFYDPVVLAARGNSQISH